MTVASGSQLPVGFRYGYIFELNDNGRPYATSGSAYEGLAFSGAKAFTVNVPDPQRIVHTGEDRVLAIDFLPSKEPVTGELRAGAQVFSLVAALSGNQVNTVGEAKELGWATDNQGSEPQVGLLFYQMSLDLTTKARCWNCYIVPKAIVVPKAAGFSENPEDAVYSWIPQVVSARLWGVTLAAGTDGFTEAQMFQYMTAGKPKLVAYVGDGSQTAFSLPTSAPATSTAKMVVIKNGTVITTNITKTTTGVTFTTAPLLGDDVDIFYEW